MTALDDRPLVLLATAADWPDGAPGPAALDAARAAQGLRSRGAVWDAPAVDWGEADVVAARSTWDYDSRLEEFLGWASEVGPALLNGAEVFRWNTDKAYLVQLHDASLPVVPTVAADRADEVRAAVGRFGSSVVKPRVGAGGRGVEIVSDKTAWEPGGDQGPWVVQPLVESIRHDGETSVFVMGGRPVSQVQKVPSGAEIRVHPEFGGSSRPVGLTDEAARLAADAVAAVGDRVGAALVYGRVDMVRHEGRLVVSEVELTEPSLYLDLLPCNAPAFAEAVASRMLRRPG